MDIAQKVGEQIETIHSCCLHVRLVALAQNWLAFAFIYNKKLSRKRFSGPAKVYLYVYSR